MAMSSSILFPFTNLQPPFTLTFSGRSRPLKCSLEAEAAHVENFLFEIERAICDI